MYTCREDREMLYLESFLEVMGHADLLQWFDLSRKTGVCSFIHGHRCRRLYLQEGMIVASESNEPHLLLGQLLISTGSIPRVLKTGLFNKLDFNTRNSSLIFAWNPIFLGFLFTLTTCYIPLEKFFFQHVLWPFCSCLWQLPWLSEHL